MIQRSGTKCGACRAGSPGCAAGKLPLLVLLLSMLVAGVMLLLLATRGASVLSMLMFRTQGTVLLLMVLLPMQLLLPAGSGIRSRTAIMVPPAPTAALLFVLSAAFVSD